jgi:hypothetical protein
VSLWQREEVQEVLRSTEGSPMIVGRSPIDRVGTLIGALPLVA